MRLALTIILMILLSPPCFAGGEPPLKDLKAKESYSRGYEFGGNLKKQEVDVDANVLLSAIRDALEGRDAAMPPAEIRDTLKELRQKVLVRLNIRREELAAKGKDEGKAFLAANRNKEGVKTLPSGLQYKVLREGTGPGPQAGDRVSVNYRGTMINGAEFDSSYSRGGPATVSVNGVIRGWTEALLQMKTGSKWQIFVPSVLAYGERAYNIIPPNSTLIFELELLSIEKPGLTGAIPAAVNEAAAVGAAHSSVKH